MKFNQWFDRACDAIDEHPIRFFACFFVVFVIGIIAGGSYNESKIKRQSVITVLWVTTNGCTYITDMHTGDMFHKVPCQVHANL